MLPCTTMETLDDHCQSQKKEYNVTVSPSHSTTCGGYSLMKMSVDATHGKFFMLFSLKLCVINIPNETIINYYFTFHNMPNDCLTEMIQIAKLKSKDRDEFTIVESPSLASKFERS